MIFAVAVNSAVIAGNDFYKFLGVSMLFVTFIEILHMLAYKGMGVFPNITTNTPTQLWVLARYLEAFTFLFAPFFYHKKKVNINLVLSVFAIITVLGVLSIFKYIPSLIATLTATDSQRSKKLASISLWLF
jgi:hypothetical protein